MGPRSDSLPLQRHGRARCPASRRGRAFSLERLGLTVRWFEDFGGRDDNAEAAYLSEVRSATLYLGLLGDAYGTMLASDPHAGFSATHAEYLEARSQGKRVSFWVREPGDHREGHARTFLNEVRQFHVTGSFSDADDLPQRVERRLREIATEDLAPWVKLGDVIVRATRVQVGATTVTVRARVNDAGALRALGELAGDPRAIGRNDVAITYGNRSGAGRIQALSEESASAAFTDVTIESQVTWSQGVDSMAAGTQGYSAEDLTEVAMRVGVLGERMPGDLGQMSFLVKAEDPLADLQGLPVQEGAVQPLARLLITEHLVGGRRASAIERFSLGPVHRGERQLELTWWEPRRYSNVEPKLRAVEGKRRWV